MKPLNETLKKESSKRMSFPYIQKEEEEVTIALGNNLKRDNFKEQKSNVFEPLKRFGSQSLVAMNLFGESILLYYTVCIMCLINTPWCGALDRRHSNTQMKSF